MENLQELNTLITEFNKIDVTLHEFSNDMRIKIKEFIDCMDINDNIPDEIEDYGLPQDVTKLIRNSVKVVVENKICEKIMDNLKRDNLVLIQNQIDLLKELREYHSNILTYNDNAEKYEDEIRSLNQQLEKLKKENITSKRRRTDLVLYNDYINIDPQNIQIELGIPEISPVNSDYMDDISPLTP